jgi:hypothetical protein
VGRGAPRFISKNNVSASELRRNIGHLHLRLLFWLPIPSSSRIWPLLLRCQGAFRGALQAPYIDPYEIVHGNAIEVSAVCLKTVYVFHRQPRLQEARYRLSGMQSCLTREGMVGWRRCRDKNHRPGHSPLRSSEMLFGRLKIRVMKILSTQNNGE